MPNYLIQRLLILGGFVIIGIVFVQSYWLLKTWDLKDKEFDQRVHIVLRKVAERIAKFNDSELPKKNLIQRTSSNYYAVNINDIIDANILEDYLYQEMENHGLRTDFEYAVYDCYSSNMVYGNYCELGDGKQQIKESSELPIFSDLVYYFIVSFPSRESYLLSNMFMTVLFSIIAILSVLFFLYSIWVILRQKKLSELQKDFINNMTHEFKTPISSIKIAADVLTKEAGIQDNPRLKRYTSIIREQNSRLNNQVEKVLNIARLEKNSFELKIEKLNLNEFVSAIADDESMKLENGQISLEFNTDHCEVSADKLHFTNVLTNILDNAIKYSSENPSIQISVNKMSDGVELSIKDTGIGIPKENLKKIFDKFYRVSTGNVHNVKGFGLGLFYVKNICDAHGWAVNITSEENTGTEIKIKIPQ